MAGLTTFATLLKAYGDYKQGKEVDRQKRMESDQLNAQAIASEAESQRTAIEDRRQADLLRSRARAVAAASGGRVSDPTVQNVMSDIGQRGEYNALSALYSGTSDANLSRLAAGAKRNEGRAARRASLLNSSGTILSGASDFYSNYKKR